MFPLSSQAKTHYEASQFPLKPTSYIIMLMGSIGRCINFSLDHSHTMKLMDQRTNLHKIMKFLRTNIPFSFKGHFLFLYFIKFIRQVTELRNCAGKEDDTPLESRMTQIHWLVESCHFNFWLYINLDLTSFNWVLTSQMELHVL